MASLAHCLKKMGLSKHEAAILKGKAGALVKDGYEAHAAATLAVKDYLDELNDERADIVRQVEKAGGKVAPIVQDFESPVDEAAHEAAISLLNEKPQPTTPQILAGNAELGHPRISGLEISIENPEGSVREDKYHTPPQWRQEMKSHYGYFRGVIGRDKDHVDVFVKPGTPEDYGGPVFIVFQDKADGSPDEHKVMIGWPDQESARHGYLENYEPGWDRIRGIQHMDVAEFKEWLKEGGPKMRWPNKRQAVEEKPTDVQFAAPPSLPWYSQLSRFIEQKGSTALAPEWQMRLAVWAKEGKVKADELEWSGLKDWIDLQQGKVTREQVLDYLRENGVRVEETELGETPPESVEPDLFGDYTEPHGKNQPVHAAWQLPGGERYRELLLTLPMADRGTQLMNDAMAVGGREMSAAERAVHPEFLRLAAAAREAVAREPEFRSSHFEQPNVLAHIRFNDRTDAEGKKVLFIEEIQSDWAQKGKRQGFAGDEKRLPFETKESQIPSAPFVGKTEAWVGLSLKRMIRYAAENGYDRVAWTTGEQQAERYSLAHQVSKIDWVSIPGTTAQHVAVHTSHGLTRFNVDDGKVVSEVANAAGLEGKQLEDVVGKEVAKKISGTQRGELEGEGLKVGGEGMKAFYDRIVPNVANDILKKLGGGRVQEVDAGRAPLKPYNEAEYVGPTPTDAQIKRVYSATKAYAPDSRTHPLTGEPTHTGQIVNRVANSSSLGNVIDLMDHGRSFAEAMAIDGHQNLAELFGGKMEEIPGKKVQLRQPGFDITPALRERALAGLPLFAAPPGWGLVEQPEEGEKIGPARAHWNRINEWAIQELRARALSDSREPKVTFQNEELLKASRKAALKAELAKERNVQRKGAIPGEAHEAAYPITWLEAQALNDGSGNIFRVGGPDLNGYQGWWLRPTEHARQGATDFLGHPVYSSEQRALFSEIRKRHLQRPEGNQDHAYSQDPSQAQLALFASIDTAGQGDENLGHVPRTELPDGEYAGAFRSARDRIEASWRSDSPLPERIVRRVAPGLDSVHDAVSARGRDIRAAERIAETFGHEVVFFEHLSPVRFAGFSSSAAPHAVFVDIDSSRPATFVAGHELFHRMSHERPDLHARFVAAVSGLIQNEEQFSHGIASQEEMRGELLADFVGWNMTRPEFWEAIKAREPTLFRRIAEYVLAFLGRMVNGLRGVPDMSRFFSDVDAAQKALIDVLTEYGADQSPFNAKLSRMFDVENPAGIKLEDLKAVATAATKGWRRQTNVIALKSFKESPASLKAAIRERNAEYNTAGAYHEGDIYLFADHIPNVERAQVVLLHEATHLGLDGILGSAADAVYLDIYTSNEMVRKQAQALMSKDRKLGVVRATEEALADMGGEGVPDTVMRRLVFAVRNFIRGIGFSLTLTDADVQALITRALRFAKNPTTTHAFGGTRFSSNIEPLLETRYTAADMAAAEAKLGKRIGEGLINKAVRVPVQLLQIDKVTAAVIDTTLEKIGGFIPEKVKAGVIADYHLPEAVTDRRAEMWAHIRRGLRGIEHALEGLAGLTRAEARVAYLWANADDPQAAEYLRLQLPEESIRVLAGVEQAIDRMSDEAERLGDLSHESRERNKFAYMRRSYKDYALNATEQEKASRARAQRIFGDQYKGRGMDDPVTMDQIKNTDPEWWRRKEQTGEADKALMGEKFLRFDRRANRGESVGVLPGMEDTGQLGRILETKYWPAEVPVPAKFGSWHQDVAEWKVIDVKGKHVIMWRDFMAQEREAMGEIDEVRFAIAKTLQGMIHDVEIGKYLEWISHTQAVPTPPRGARTTTGDESALRSMFRTFEPDEWVQVPDAEIPGTGGVKRYGKLAGLWVPGPVWNDIRQTVQFRYQPFGETYAHLLKAWKISKTALSPAVHMNNIMANVVMADFRDLGPRHMLRALEVMFADSPENQIIRDRFEDAGGTQGMFVLSELQRQQIEPLIEALRKEMNEAEGSGAAIQAGNIISLITQLRWREALAAAQQSKLAGAPGWVVRKMMDLYQGEDTIFRMAAFMKAKSEGRSDTDAGREARQSFLDYQINAPWIQMMRATAFPFISFTYRAIPMLVDIAAHKPWKLLKLGLVAGALNALGYALSGGDEDKERKLLPEEKSGKILGFLAPKMLRMPWNDDHDAPVFLDVTRWVPVGDIFETGESAIPVFGWMLPGGPLDTFWALRSNHDAFTNKPITKGTDTAAEVATKSLGYLYRAFAPNLVLLPGTYANDALMNAAGGATDLTGNDLSVGQAALSSIGVKLSSRPNDLARFNLNRAREAQTREIQENIGKLKRDLQTQKLTPDQFQEHLDGEIQKLDKVNREFLEKVQ